MRHINLKSFDFDGCIFNLSYIYDGKMLQARRILKHNQAFIARISQQIAEEKYDEVVFMVGSNRQSQRVDDVNSDGKGSCYPALIVLGKEIKKNIKGIPCRLDPYLLADTYGNKPLGENYINALPQNEKNSYQFNDWIFDDSKLTILYAQIHKAASENPDAEIVYDFYDDRDDILNGLAGFFKENRDLMPRNLKMRIHRYAGEAIKPLAEIQGVGEVDENYHENIRLMVDLAGYKYPRDVLGYSHVRLMLANGHNRGLRKFKEQRQLKRPSEIPPLTAIQVDLLADDLSREEKKNEKVKSSIAHPLSKPKNLVTGNSGHLSAVPLFIPNESSDLAEDLKAIDNIHKKIFYVLNAEYKNFLKRKGRLSLRALTEKDCSRFMVLSDLRAEVGTIKEEVKSRRQISSDYSWKDDYKARLTSAIKTSLLNRDLDKYDDNEKLGIKLLNLVTFLFSPLKRLVTRSWFYSPVGKPKEAVEETLKIVNAIPLQNR